MKKNYLHEVFSPYLKFTQLFRIMKLTTLILFLTIWQLQAIEIYAQSTTVNLNMKNVKIDEVFKAIEHQSDFEFFYNDKQIDVNKYVSINVNNTKISDVINKLFANNDLSYKVIGKRIVLVKSNSYESELLKTLLESQQQQKISGKVTDISGQPLTGVVVNIKGTDKSVITDVSGKYSITINNNDKILVFSFIGMVRKEVPINGQSILDVVMESEITKLDEVVVVGYGTQRKSDITGAVSSVRSNDLTKIATYSPLQALQGRAAGVSVIQDSGSPDAAASIQIRGIGTTNNNTPLFVVNGLPMSDINYLNPTDIETIEILKDASACAIYGSRGANGVVLVTTKKGEAGALKVNLNAYFGVESLAKKPSLLNSTQYAQLSNEAYINAGKDPIYSNVNNLANNTDWYKEVSQLGTIKNYNLSLSGGGPKINTRFSINDYKNTGIMKSTDFEKLTIMQNTTMKVTDFLDIETSLSGAFSHHKALDATSIFLTALIAPPDIPVIDPATKYYTGVTKLWLNNPAGMIARNNAKYNNTYLIGDVSANLKITKDLSFKSSFGISREEYYNSDFMPIYYETADISSLYNQVSRSASKTTDWTLDNILTYHKIFNGVHDLTVMGAISAREYKSDYFSATKQGIENEDDAFWYLDAATVNPQATGNGASLSQLSYLGRINYTFKNRYLLTGSIRDDGSSRFIGSNRWGVFPSGAFGWKITEEEFMKRMNIRWLSSAKIRVGYGQLGNENISSYYPYLTPIGQQQYYTLGTSQSRVNGSGPTALGNPEVKWETSNQSNIGIDLSLIKNLLTVTADYYIRKTDNILLTQQVPQISGSSSIIRNVGGMQNKGFEFAVAYRNSTKAFTYDISANMSTVQNKVTNLGNSDALMSSFAYNYALINFQGALGNMIRSEVGKPYGQFYGWQTDGIFQNQNEVDQYTHNGKKIQPDAKPGDFRFKDINGDGAIDNSDETVIGNPIPDITFGLSFNATYKNFDLSLLFQGTAGNDIYNAAKYYFMMFNGTQNVRTDYLNSYWHGEGTSNSQPAVTSDLTRNGNNYRNSSYYVENGSYLRLKTLQLGYNLSTSINKQKVKVRFYISAQNLFTITGYSGYEPEISGNGVDTGIYPQARIFMLGTDINF